MRRRRQYPQSPHTPHLPVAGVSAAKPGKRVCRVVLGFRALNPGLRGEGGGNDKRALCVTSIREAGSHGPRHYTPVGVAMRWRLFAGRGAGRSQQELRPNGDAVHQRGQRSIRRYRRRTVHGGDPVGQSQPRGNSRRLTNRGLPTAQGDPRPSCFGYDAGGSKLDPTCGCVSISRRRAPRQGRVDLAIAATRRRSASIPVMRRS